jgi:hypothetical protein
MGVLEPRLRTTGLEQVLCSVERIKLVGYEGEKKPDEILHFTLHSKILEESNVKRH